MLSSAPSQMLLCSTSKEVERDMLTGLNHVFVAQIFVLNNHGSYFSIACKNDLLVMTMFNGTL